MQCSVHYHLSHKSLGYISGNFIFFSFVFNLILGYPGIPGVPGAPGYKCLTPLSGPIGDTGYEGPQGVPGLCVLMFVSMLS